MAHSGRDVHVVSDGRRPPQDDDRGERRERRRVPASETVAEEKPDRRVERGSHRNRRAIGLGHPLFRADDEMGRDIERRPEERGSDGSEIDLQSRRRREVEKCLLESLPAFRVFPVEGGVLVLEIEVAVEEKRRQVGEVLDGVGLPYARSHQGNGREEQDRESDFGFFAED